MKPTCLGTQQIGASRGVEVTVKVSEVAQQTKANGSPTACESESWGAALAITEIDKGISRGTHT